MIGQRKSWKMYDVKNSRMAGNTHQTKAEDKKKRTCYSLSPVKHLHSHSFTRFSQLPSAAILSRPFCLRAGQHFSLIYLMHEWRLYRMSFIMCPGIGQMGGIIHTPHSSKHNQPYQIHQRAIKKDPLGRRILFNKNQMKLWQNWQQNTRRETHIRPERTYQKSKGQRNVLFRLLLCVSLEPFIHDNNGQNA